MVAEADVAVIGSGLGGLGAAMMAAREGARVALAERYGFPGGMADSAGVSPFMHNHVVAPPPLVCIDAPVCREWQSRINGYRTPPSDTHLPLTRELARLTAEDMLVAAVVQLRYHHTLVDVIRDGGRIRHAVGTRQVRLRRHCRRPHRTRRRRAVCRQHQSGTRPKSRIACVVGNHIPAIALAIRGKAPQIAASITPLPPAYVLPGTNCDLG